MLIQPAGGETPARFACQYVLMPRDSDPNHEQGLPVPADLARARGASLHLLRIVPTLGTLPSQHGTAARLLPGATSALLDLAEGEAEAQLREQVARLQAAGLRASAEVQRGDSAALIVRDAKRIDADLVVLGTHMRTGLEAFWSESVAPQVLGRTHAPLLLVPVRELAAEND